MYSDRNIYEVTERDRCEDCGARLRWDDSCPRCNADPTRISEPETLDLRQ
jgi:hypothetical protein